MVSPSLSVPDGVGERSGDADRANARIARRHRDRATGLDDIQFCHGGRVAPAYSKVMSHVPGLVAIETEDLNSGCGAGEPRAQ